MGDFLELIQSHLDILKSILESNTTSDNEGTISDIIQKLHENYLNFNLKEQEREIGNAHLFSDNGILTLLRCILLMKEMKNIKLNCFKLLDDIIKHSGPLIGEYGSDILDICKLYMKRDVGADVKKASMVTISLILETSHGYNGEKKINIKSLMEDLFFQLSMGAKLTSRAKEEVLCLIGIIAHYYPGDFIPYQERVLSMFLQELKSQMNAKVKAFNYGTVTGCLLGLKEYLYNFSVLYSDEMEKSFFIFDVARKMVSNVDAFSVKTSSVNRAGLQLLAAHAPQFGLFIFDECIDLYENLMKWVKFRSRDMQKLGREALVSVLKVTSEMIMHQYEENKDMCSKMFKFFMKEFREIFLSKDTTSKELQIAVMGYGLFAGPCKLCLSEVQVKKMLQNVIQKSEHEFFGTNQRINDKILNLNYYIESLSAIVSVTECMTENILFSLEKLVVFQIDKFPLVPTSYNFIVPKAIIRMLLAILPKKEMFMTFLSQIVYQGLVKTCSHPVVVEAEAMKDKSFGKEFDSQIEKDFTSAARIITYKDYISLWKDMLNVIRFKELNSLGIPLESRQYLMECIYDEVIRSSLNLLSKLDLSLHQSSKSNDDAMDEKVDVSCDPLFGVQPNNMVDYYIFINLVDFLRDLLSDRCTELFSKWVYIFGREMIFYASKYPFHSGFYKLIAVDLSICSKIGYFKIITNNDEIIQEKVNSNENNIQQSFTLFSKFIKEIAVRHTQFRDDLLASCLQVMLVLPMEIVVKEIHMLIPALESALKLGISYLPLAEKSVSALEKWSKHIEQSIIKPYFPVLLPLLNSYLLATAVQGETSQLNDKSSSTKRSTHKMTTKSTKRSNQSSLDNTLEDSDLTRIQLQILRFLGQLGESNAALLEKSHEKVDDVAIAWDPLHKNHLKYSVPFVDMKPDIYFDDFLPRIMEIATKSSVRQVKVAACESLHSLVLFMVGHGSIVPDNLQEKFSMEALYAKLFPGLLELSCDVEQVTKQLFSPLVFQIIHWFTCNKVSQTQESSVILLCLWDGVTNPQSAALRDFSAICLKEYFHWSIKQSSPGKFKQIDRLLNKLHSFALHPNAFKRLGSALTFNSIYSIFRNEEHLVKKYTLHLLVLFVDSLAIAHMDNTSLGTQKQCINALTHIGKIITFKYKYFIKSEKTRKKPECLEEATLRCVVLWLLKQCGCIQTECRHKCMDLVVKLAPLIPDSRDTTTFVLAYNDDNRNIVEDVFEDKLRNFSQNELSNHIAYKSLSTWLEALQTSMECYQWAFSKQLMLQNVLREEKHSSIISSVKVFNAIEYLIENIANKSLTSVISKHNQKGDDLFTPDEVLKYNRLKCTVLVRLMNFIVSVFAAQAKWFHDKFFKVLWNSSLWEIILLVVISPSSLGFDMTDPEVATNLPVEVLILMEKLSKKSDFKAFCLKYLKSKENFDLVNMLPIKLMNSKFSTLHVMEILNGYELLIKSGFDVIDLFEKPIQIQDSLLDSIWNDSLTDDGVNCKKVTLNPSSIILAEKMLSVTYIMGLQPELLATKLLDSSCNGNSKVFRSKGLIIFNIYVDSMCSFAAKNPEKFLKTISNSLNFHSFSEISILLKFIDYVAHTKGLRRKNGKDVIHAFLGSWSRICSWWNNHTDADTIYSVLSLITKMLLIDSKVALNEFDEFSISLFPTYISMLTKENNTMDFIVHALDILPFFCEVSKNSKTLSSLRLSLEEMMVNHFPLQSTELHIGSSTYHTYISVLKNMLSALSLTGCSFLLEVLTLFFCKEINHILEADFQKCIVDMLRSKKSSDHQTYADVVFSLIMKSSFNTKSDVLLKMTDRVLIIILQSVCVSSFINFFQSHIKEIMSTIKENLSLVTGAKDIHLIKRIACYKVLELMYGNLNKDLLHSKESHIVETYIGRKPEVGNEMSTDIIKLTLEFKKTSFDAEPEFKDLLRKLNCAKYNTLIAVVSCTQHELKFYNAFLFKEIPAKNEHIWKRIACEEKLTFSMEVDESSISKTKFVAIRHKIRKEIDGEVKEEDTSEIQSSLQLFGSENLALSSLAEDVSKFVFTTNEQVFKPQENTENYNKTMTHAQASEKKKSEPDYLEVDDMLNRHECMMALTCLIKNMKAKNFIPEETDNSLPAWLSAIIQSLEDRKSSDNVKLFLGRFLTNNSKLLQPYASFLIGPLLNLIVLGTAGFSLNYYILDIIITVLSWASTAIPEGGEMLKASEVLKFVMTNIEHERKDIFRNNLEVVKTILECWKTIKIPFSLIYEKMSDFSSESKQNLFGIQLLGVVLSSDFPPYDPLEESEGQSYLSTLLKNLSMKYKEVYGAAAEVIALTLKYIFKTEKNILKNFFFLKVSDQLELLKPKEESKFLYCLNKIHICCPEIANRFIPHLLFLYPRVHGVYKNYILEVFFLRVLHFENSYQQLKHIGVFENLEKKNEVVQHLSLQILEKLIPGLSCDDILYILPSIVGIHAQPSVRSRLALFKILFLLFEKFCDSSGAKEKEITRSAQENLLVGLADPNPSIRLIVDNFWSDEKRLPLGTKERLVALMKNMFSPVTEESFLQYSTFLLLERTSVSPDYKRKIFEHPLSQCNFQAYKIQTSARKRHMAMSPLFTETASSSTYSSLMYSESLSSFGHELKLKATQANVEFSETSDISDEIKKRDTYNWLTERSLDTFALQESSSDSAYSSYTKSPTKTHLFALKNEKKVSNSRFQNLNEANETKKDKRSTTWMLKRRFLKDKADSDTFARQELRRQDRRKELLKDQQSHRDAQIVMYRQYRIGELPDIEISNSAIIQPIQALAMNDVNIAKLLFKSLVSAICETINKELPEGYEAFCKEIGSCFEDILQKSYLNTPPVISFCLETLNIIPNINFDVETVFNSCIGSNQQSVGILLLESKLMEGFLSEPKQKKVRKEKHVLPEESSYWMKLAELYRSINDYDVVNGIFSLTMGQRGDNRKALQYECSGQYYDAAILYKKLYENTSDEYDQAEKDFWDKSVLSCLNKLSKWEDLEAMVICRFTDEGTTEDLQRIWEDEYMKDVYLPYLVRSKLKLLLTGNNEQALLTFFDKSRSDDSNKTHLEIHFSEELALLYILQDKFDIARQYCSLCLKRFLKEWQNLSPVAVEMQHAVLQNLLKYVELDDFLHLIKKNSCLDSPSVINTIKIWQKRFPNAIDPVDIWDDMVTNRHLYMKKLEENLDNQSERMEISLSNNLDEDIQDDDFKKTALNTSVHVKLRFAENCAAKGNFPVATATLKNIYKVSRSLDGATWSQFIEAYCSINNQRVLSSSSNNNLNIVLGSYKQLVELEKRCGQSVSQKKLLSKTLELIAEMFLKNDISMDTLEDDKLEQIYSISDNKSSQVEVISEILDKSFLSLKSVIGVSPEVSNTNGSNRENIAAAHMELANFCNRYLTQDKEKSYDPTLIPSFSEFPRVLIKSLLNALQYGSSDAHLLFPRLLQVIESHPDCLPVFQEKVSKMPCWLFIRWIDQLVALLDKQEAKAVHEIIENITLQYPDAIIYAFHLSCEGYEFSNSKVDGYNKKFIEKIKCLLEKQTLISDFVTALNHLSVPSVIFKDCIQEMKQIITSKAPSKQIKQCYTRVYNKLFALDTSESNRVPIGPLQKQFAEVYKDQFLKICGNDGNKLLVENKSKEVLQALSELAAESSTKFKKISSLKDASPWLSEFQQWKYSSQIEIPGQYSGKGKPLPEYHVKIAGFDGKVLILPSLTSPLRITIRGNDEKEYKILVKSGEDLRQDARIQQMFSVMNEIYARDINCAQRHLSLKTYKVVPLSTRLGLIEWVDNTTVLMEFLNDGMSEEERKKFYPNPKSSRHIAQSKFLQWEKADKILPMYESLYTKKSRDECVQKYKELVDLVPKNLLTKSFLKLSSSPEAFIVLRTKYAKSHAVMCISQWIIGIGDRHLGNFLIDKTSGCEIGIDFGHAFGSATQFLPVPELVPFRLSPQYLQLMNPLRVKGIYEATMVHTLSAICSKRDLLLNVMDIFIKEPTLDWQFHARTQQQVLGKISEGNDEKFLKQRVMIARKKLEGVNPAFITRKELELGHSSRSYFQKMSAVCLGNVTHNIRAQLNKTGLSVEEQVDCLIDQATDPYILCLIYFGWNPWI